MIKCLWVLCPARMRAVHNNWHKLDVVVASSASDSASVTLPVATLASTMWTWTQSVAGYQPRITSLRTQATMRRCRAETIAVAVVSWQSSSCGCWMCAGFSGAVVFIGWCSHHSLISVQLVGVLTPSSCATSVLQWIQSDNHGLPLRPRQVDRMVQFASAMHARSSHFRLPYDRKRRWAVPGMCAPLVVYANKFPNSASSYGVYCNSLGVIHFSSNWCRKSSPASCHRSEITKRTHCSESTANVLQWDTCDYSRCNECQSDR